MGLHQSLPNERRSMRWYFSVKRLFITLQRLLPCLSQCTLDWAADGPFFNLSSQTQCKGWELVSGDILSTGPLMPLACCPCEVNGQDKCMPKRGSDGIEYRTLCISYKVLWTLSFFNKIKKNPIDCRNKEVAGGENVGPHVLTQVQGLTGLWSHSSATAELGHFSLVN